MRYTFKSEVVYECNNDVICVQVVTTCNIMWKFKVLVHDIDEGEIVGTKSFKTKREAEAYADLCMAHAA